MWCKRENRRASLRWPEPGQICPAWRASTFSRETLACSSSFTLFFPKDIHAWIQISNLSGLFPPSHTLNFLMNVLHIFKYAPSRNEDMRISPGYRDSCLAALTMATVPPSDCHSSLCIYANVCLDITDSSVIVSLPAFKKIWLKSSKTESDRTTEHFCNSRRTGGLHANNHISIAKSFYCH